MRRWLPLAASLLLPACAVPAGGEAAPRWPRPAHLDPWWMSGPTPTPETIEQALYGVHTYGQDHCPFRLATCDDANEDRRGTTFRVSRVACEQVDEHHDRCAFDLEETVAGRGRARSRCTARFGIYGTSDDAAHWEVDEDEYDRARLRCGPAR